MPVKRSVRYRRRRLLRRRGYGSLASKRTSKNRQIGVLKQLIPHSTHLFKRLGVSVPIGVVWNATNSSAQIQNPGILIADGGNVFLDGWKISNGTNSFFFGSNGDAAVPTTTAIAPGTNSLLGSNNYQFGGSAYFSLRSVQQYTDFTQLFDQYKICGIRLSIRYHHNVATYGSPATIPTIYYMVDYDDNTPPSSKNTFLQHEGCRQRLLNGNTVLNIKWRPTTLQNVLTDGVAANPVVRKGGYNNSSDAEVNYFGFKFWIDNLYVASGVQQLIEITPSFILAFKDTI